MYVKDRRTQQMLLDVHGVTPGQLEVAEQHAPGQSFAVLVTLPGIDGPEQARATLRALIVEQLPSIADDVTIGDE
jgi:hypothetical protein